MTSPPAVNKAAGPDPVIGVGLVMLGVLIMGIAGAATLHYVFNVGTAIAIVGAVVFLVSVALSSLREKKLAAPAKKPSSAAHKSTAAHKSAAAGSSGDR